MGRSRYFDSVTRGRSIGISFWLGSQLFERPLCRFLRCGCDDELRLLHLDSGHPLTGLCQGAIRNSSQPECRVHISKHNFQPPAFLQTLTAPVFSLCWLRTESRQSPIRFKHVAMCCDCPGGVDRPRETLVPSRVQRVGHISVAVAMATPVRNGLTAWAIQSSALHRVAQRRRPIIQ